MSEPDNTSLPVALVYGEAERCEVLRHALGAIGTDVVCDESVDDFNIDKLGASGAEVVLISLDDVIDERLDEVYGALDEDRYRVMFDDPEISSKLDGWELARWQRHLAAKLRDVADWDPPRPQDAEPVDVGANRVSAERQSGPALAVVSDTGSGTVDAPEAESMPPAQADLQPVRHESNRLLAPEIPEPETPSASAGDPPPLPAVADVAAGEPEDGDPLALLDEPPAMGDTPTPEAEDDEPGDVAPIADPAGVEDAPNLEDDALFALDELDDIDAAPPPNTPPAPSPVSEAVAPAESDAVATPPDPSEPPPMSATQTTSNGDGVLDDAQLEAELDALASADDPLAALSNLAAQGNPRSPDLGDEHAMDEPPAPRDGTPGSGGSVDPAIAPPRSRKPDYLEPPPAADGDADNLQAELETLASADSAPGQADAERGAMADPGAQPQDDDTGLAPTPDDASSGDDSDEWGRLEAELNSAFDSDSLNAIDQAADATDTAIPDDVPAWETPAATPASQPSESQPDADAALDLAADDDPQSWSSDALATDDDPQSRSSDALATDDPGTESSAKPEPQHTAKFEMPDVSQWALVDDDDPIAAHPPSASADTAVTEDTAAGAANASDGDATEDMQAAYESDDDNFGLEILEPEDFLEPEAPRDVTTELFNVPTTIPMAEAVAPEIAGEEVSDNDADHDVSRGIQQVVVLAVATGGPDAVREFLSHLPQRLPALVVLVQPLGSEFQDLMVSQLAKATELPVRIPARAERAVHGEVIVVPGGHDIRLDAQGQLQIEKQDSDDDGEQTINRTLSMLADGFGAGTTAIVFSGMGADVVQGARDVVDHQGQVWVQDPDSCVVSAMVDAVIGADLAGVVGTPAALAKQLLTHLQEANDAANK